LQNYYDYNLFVFWAPNVAQIEKLFKWKTVHTEKVSQFFTC